MMIFAFSLLATEHVSRLASALVTGLEVIVRFVLPFVLITALTWEGPKIGKTLHHWLRWIVRLHVRRLRRIARDAETLTLFWGISLKLRPAPRPRTKQAIPKPKKRACQPGEASPALLGTPSSSEIK